MNNNINHGSITWFNTIIISVLYSDLSRKLLLSRNDGLKIKRNFKLNKYFTPKEIIALRENNNKFKIGYLRKGFLTQLYLKPFFKLLKLKPIMLIRFSDNLLAYNIKNHIKMVDFSEDYTNYQSRIICEKYKQEKLARNSDVFIIETIDDKQIESVKKCYDDFLYHYIENKEIASLSDNFLYNGINYSLDSIIITNYNNTQTSHAIIGFTMNNKKYIYIGISKKPIKFDWLANKNNDYYLNTITCKLELLTNNISNNVLKFSFNKGKRLFVYVKNS